MLCTDLISRMTLSEKITQLGTSAGAVARLTVPAYQWYRMIINVHYSITIHRWCEALHGVAGSPGVHFGGQVLAKQNNLWIA